MQSLIHSLRNLCLAVVVFCPWILYIYKPLDGNRTSLIHFREVLLDKLGSSGETLIYNVLALMAFAFVFALVFGSQLVKTVFRRLKFVSRAFYDPRLSSLALVLLGLLFWFSAVIYCFEAPFSVPPLDPDRVSLFATNYAQAVWATIVYLLGGIEVSDLRSVVGRLAALTLLIANLAVVGFFLAAYKEKLERRLRHHKLKDKPYGLRLKGHLIICGASKMIKAILAELDAARYDQDIVIVARDLDRTFFVGLDRIYDRVWAIRGSLADEDVMRMANLDTANHVLVLPQTPRSGSGTTTSGRKVETDDAANPADAASLVMAIESVNPMVCTCLLMDDDQTTSRLRRVSGGRGSCWGCRRVFP